MKTHHEGHEGHETKYGPYAGNTQKRWTKKRVEEVKKYFAALQGFSDITSSWEMNWDWEI